MSTCTQHTMTASVRCAVQWEEAGERASGLERLSDDEGEGESELCRAYEGAQ